MEEICKKVEYFNKILKHILEIEIESLKKFLRALQEADGIFLNAEGRSLSSLLIAMTGLTKLHNKSIYTFGHVNCPCSTPEEVASFLSGKHEKIVIVVNSGSGNTLTVKSMIDKIVKYIEETGTKKITIVAIGSHPESPIGKKIKEINEYGIFIKLKGREREAKKKEDYSKVGIMNDMFELTSLVLLQIIKEAINNNKDVDWIFQKIKEEMKIVGENVDKYVESEQYEKLLEKIMSIKPKDIVLGGLGSSRETAKMNAIRLQHILREIENTAVYISGPMSPSPSKNDVFIAISYSGETPIVNWAEDYRQNGGYVAAIVGNDKSTLSKTTESYSINNSSDVDQYYRIVNFLLSAVIVGLMEKIGYVSEESMRHSKAQ